MEVFKTMAYVDDDLALASPIFLDTICHEGIWWLVPAWGVLHSGGGPEPEIVVLLTGLSHEEVHGLQYRFRLHNPIPKSVLEGKAQAGYVVEKNPKFAPIQTPKSKLH